MSTQTSSSHLAIEQNSRINPRIFLLALGTFALGTDANVVAGILPIIAKETGVTVSTAGQLVTVFSLTYGIGAPLLAALTALWRPNRVLIVALGTFSLANLLSALAPSFPILMLSRVLAGCLAAMYAPLAFTVSTAIAPPGKRGLVLGLIGLGYTTASGLGSPLGTWIGERLGWRASFGLIVVLAGCAFLVLALAGLPKIEQPPVVSLRARLAPLTQPLILLLLASAWIWYTGIYLVYTYVAPLLQQSLHVNDISGLLIIFGIGSMLGNIFGGRMADRFGSTPLIIVFLGVLIITGVTLPFTFTNLIGAIPTLFIWGMSMAVLFTTQQHRLLSTAAMYANVIMAFNGSTLYLGMASGAALGGFLIRIINIQLLAPIASACALVALLIVLTSMRFKMRTGSTEEIPSIAQKDEIPLEGFA